MCIRTSLDLTPDREDLQFGEGKMRLLIQTNKQQPCHNVSYYKTIQSVLFFSLIHFFLCILWFGSSMTWSEIQEKLSNEESAC